MKPPTSDEQIRFLVNLQRLLDEGAFVASYKFTLLLALADLSVEQGEDNGRPVTLHIRSTRGPRSYGGRAAGRSDVPGHRTSQGRLDLLMVGLIRAVQRRYTGYQISIVQPRSSFSECESRRWTGARLKTRCPNIRQI